MTEKPLKIRQVAEMVGVDPTTIRRWCAAGKGPEHFKTPGGVLLFPADAARQWVATVIASYLLEDPRA